jgi:hypothetical protein
MDIYARIKLFSILGNQIKASYKNQSKHTFGNRLEEKIIEAEQKNPWFTKENITFCLLQWADLLTEEKLTNWINNYKTNWSNKTVGIILAGNIPMVGFHDLLCVFFSGYTALVKLSSKDDVLIPFLINELIEIEPKLKEIIQFVEKLEQYDAIIATGSNNTARYFEQYFQSTPNIIRKNRTSIAILTGDETEDDLLQLSHDVFRYFGLGCRNVTKLYLPKEYEVKNIFEAFESYNSVQFHHKYFNNYTYHKAIFLMNQDQFLDNNFFMIKQDKQLFSPISCLFYDAYENLDQLEKEVEAKKEQIQIIVAKSAQIGSLSTVDFGQSQSPKLEDYADGVDVMRFLHSL